MGGGDKLMKKVSPIIECSMVQLNTWLSRVRVIRTIPDLDFEVLIWSMQLLGEGIAFFIEM